MKGTNRRTRFLYRVTFGHGQPVSNPQWSEKDAREFAKYATRFGAMKACVERAVKYPGGRHGEYDQVTCYRRKAR